MIRSDLAAVRRATVDPDATTALAGQPETTTPRDHPAKQQRRATGQPDENAGPPASQTTTPGHRPAKQQPTLAHHPTKQHRRARRPAKRQRRARRPAKRHRRAI
jgi:hypothetical protein